MRLREVLGELVGDVFGAAPLAASGPAALVAVLEQQKKKKKKKKGTIYLENKL